MTTPAHTQEITLHYREFFPEHEPREHDPHYHIFNEARKKLKDAGKLVCWVCGKDESAAGHPIELHHDKVEFALQNGIDVGKFEEAYPDLNIHNEEEFFTFVEGEGNLLPLCKLHHTGIEGIHVLPYPCWRVIKVWREDLPPPGEMIK